MVNSFWDEEWREIDLGEDKLRNNYSISNYGRLVSYTDSKENGKLLKGSIVDGYPVFFVDRASVRDCISAL